MDRKCAYAVADRETIKKSPAAALAARTDARTGKPVNLSDVVAASDLLLRVEAERVRIAHVRHGPTYRPNTPTRAAMNRLCTSWSGSRLYKALLASRS